jgi:hypothetical protein
VLSQNKTIPAYYLYRPGSEDKKYIITDTAIFLHVNVPLDATDKTISSSKYVLISEWVETPPTGLNFIYSAQTYLGNKNVYTAVYKDSNFAKYWVYSHEGPINIFAPDTSTRTTTTTITDTSSNTMVQQASTLTSYAASPPVQPPVTIQSIHQKLLPLFTSGTTGSTTWNPLLARPLIADSVVFNSNTDKNIRSLDPRLLDNNLVTRDDYVVLDGIAQRDAKDSMFILHSMFANMNPVPIERRSYFVITRWNGKKLVVTYNWIFLHTEITQNDGSFGLNLLIDNSQQTALQPTHLLTPDFTPTVPNPPSDPLVQTNSQINPGPSVAQPSVAQPATIASQAAAAQHASVAPGPAFTTAFVSLHATPVPIVAEPNAGAQATSPYCDASEENCYVWKFTDASEGWLPTGLQFNVPLDVMNQRGSVDSVTNGEYKLTFVGRATHVTHIKISYGVKSYDLAAIRPDNMHSMHSGMSSYQSTAVFEKTGSTGPIFVRCKLEVKHSRSPMRPGVYAEWVVPHLDTGRWITTGNGDASQLPPLIPKAKTVSMGYRGSEPASVVSSFAPAARYEGEPMEYRINGLDTGTVASKMDDTDARGGDVNITDAERQGYDLGQLRGRYQQYKKTLNHIYFDGNDGNAYKTNPHFRFRPPWWSSQNPQFRIACVGDSLTEGWMCTWLDKLPKEDPRTYPNLLRTYLADVGIPASVENFGISGAKMWSKSKRYDLVVNYQDAIDDGTKLTSNTNWFGNAQDTYDLMIIWLGTNDAAEIGDEIDKQGENIIQVQIQGDFEKIIRHRRAKHYLLVEIDGRRRNQNAITQNLPCLESQPGNIDATCETDPNEKKGAECINKAIAALEQKYQNVHVASIDFMKDRCPGGERPDGSPPFYIHFARNEGIAKSIFGRIMCHAIFHRETGDLRWVGAEPNKKLKSLPSLQSL